MIIYCLIGVIIAFVSIAKFRRDGTTTRKGELYLAAIAPFIWPIVLLKLAVDLGKE